MLQRGEQFNDVLQVGNVPPVLKPPWQLEVVVTVARRKTGEGQFCVLGKYSTLHEPSPDHHLWAKMHVGLRNAKLA